ncbi:TSUP family transporter [bacterium]|nr:TSUP family transporter [bacterium]
MNSVLRWRERRVPETHIVILIGAITFGATLVRSTLGFGDALIAMPLLAFILPLRTAAPFIAALSVFNALVILFHEWRHVSFGEVRPLILAALCGIPLGVWLLSDGDQRFVTALLAVLVLGFSIWNLWRPESLHLATDRAAPLFGIISGVLGGAYNTAGPTLVIFGTLRRWEASRFRANLQSYFVVSGSLVFLAHLSRGNVTVPVVTLFAICAPLTLLSTAIGRRMTQTIPRVRFTRYVHVGLLLIGLVLLGRTLTSGQAERGDASSGTQGATHSEPARLIEGDQP